MDRRRITFEEFWKQVPLPEKEKSDAANALYLLQIYMAKETWEYQQSYIDNLETENEALRDLAGTNRSRFS